ncbi:adenosine receptor a3-like [Limosa lapponica baueri]|uniref:Adenosine receptor a3-like n=1 Tax=Limosa lapponica baueri TaxID=1758121 RepID=A0A2I0TFP3_LIMLA|nr:adenosine receptor a3-like [Limosa lapponica baueri]
MANESLVLSSLDGIYIGTECLVALFATLGNILVIWVVKLNLTFQNTTLYFIVSLALADIAVGVLVMPLAIVVSLGISLHFYTCLFMCCLMVVFTNASILSLLAIAIDRYLRVKVPTRPKLCPVTQFNSINEQASKGSRCITISEFCYMISHYRDRS